MADQAAPADAQSGQDPAGAQPDQGTGGNELHEQFISSVPEQHREIARQLVPYWDKTVQGKFTEHSDYKKQWEPYEAIEGFKDTPPEQLTELMEWDRNVRSDPEKFWEWYDEVGQLRESDGSDDDSYDDYESLAEDPRVAELKTQLSELTKWKEQMDEHQRESQEAQMLAKGQEIVRQDLDTIKKDHFPEMSEEDERAIYRFASAYDTRDAIQKGFEDYKKLISRFETGMFEKKTQAPDAAESGGKPDTAAPPVTSFEDANRIARERIRQQ